MKTNYEKLEETVNTIDKLKAVYRTLEPGDFVNEEAILGSLELQYENLLQLAKREVQLYKQVTNRGVA